MLSTKTFKSPRQTTQYLEAGPAGGPLMIFLHGWPEIGLIWRAQMEAFAADGWRCVAPDMRGYGGSSAPDGAAPYALEQIVDDMVELHRHLGGKPAVWVGHDLGSPVAGALAAHHPNLSRGVVLASIPYFPQGFALANLVPLVDRQLYPAAEYPDGQWDYCRFYVTNFDTTVQDFNADIPATLAAIYRPGSPAGVGKVYRSALVSRNGGWFGSAHRAPVVAPDPSLWPPADFDKLVAAFRVTGFRAGNAWYLNDAANIAYAHTAPDGGRLRQPVLFVNGDYDGLCDIRTGRISEPMRGACEHLSIAHLSGGHWLPVEQKAELIDAIRGWLKATGTA
ncbi:alpha/beta hydrolase [Phenylobacterium sp.]|uniref:alpha/beta hydrolase n=1 Tax=Phenylobacterium sp. TaxID=1871053 RepID=UPI0025E8A694|nr:alpha/beta hydrolase [Phenylobacterium sp.]